MKQYALALDLKEDPALIREYEEWHRKVAPPILKSMQDAGIRQMRIFRYLHRMFMILEVEDDFSFEKKAVMDLANPEVQTWENRMWHYQQALPGSKPGEKWILLEEIFNLDQLVTGTH